VSVTFRTIGGPTTVVEVGGRRLLVDPTFDEPRDYEMGGGRTLTKTQGPALSAAEIGPLDAVLLSHDQHADNLDESGRALLAGVPVTYTTPLGAEATGSPPTTQSRNPRSSANGGACGSGASSPSTVIDAVGTASVAGKPANASTTAAR